MIARVVRRSPTACSCAMRSTSTSILGISMKTLRLLRQRSGREMRAMRVTQCLSAWSNVLFKVRSMQEQVSTDSTSTWSVMHCSLPGLRSNSGGRKTGGVVGILPVHVREIRSAKAWSQYKHLHHFSQMGKCIVIKAVCYIFNCQDPVQVSPLLQYWLAC